ncbi:hypothetical protein C2845_PM04G04520 [Panicum miliaceum]|uniref:Uncharacterized protein n=1 Tax=Panicum miliaceum TaxID=4540 RepID=A0A3L6QQR1_PANMI|nr:hypothetical protein C2845_PM04G04520 [Panicum miliaceum]
MEAQPRDSDGDDAPWAVPGWIWRFPGRSWGSAEPPGSVGAQAKRCHAGCRRWRLALGMTLRRPVWEGGHCRSSFAGLPGWLGLAWTLPRPLVKVQYGH